MHDIAIIGGGKIGAVVAQLLHRAGDYRVTVIDRSRTQLDRLEGCEGVETVTGDIADGAALRSALIGKFAVISAAPYFLTTRIAEAALAAGAHYLDLTEDVVCTRVVKVMADEAQTVLMPQCGLAPGFITVVAHDIAAKFETLHDVRMRVGALPQYPSNTLGYNLTWSTDGVINEYCEPCEAIVDGRLRETPALEECERLALDGVEYEAFNTSGGLGTLCETLKGRVQNLNYRTIRYPGHAAIMKTLLNDLGLRHRREVLKDIFETALPATVQDVVIVFVTVSGMKAGRLTQETYAHKIYARMVGGVMRSAIQVTTAAGVCAALDLLADGRLPQQGFVRQEQIPLRAFLDNRFGAVYADDGRALDPLWSSDPLVTEQPRIKAIA